MWRYWQFFAATCILILLSLRSSFGDDTPPAAPGFLLSISTHTTKVRIGTAVVLRGKVSNRSESPLLLPFQSKNFRIQITGNGVAHTVAIPAYTTARSEHFKYVPLLPNSSYEWIVPATINEISAIPETAMMLEPGAYEVRLQYRSARTDESTTEPVWIGSTTSNKQTVIISPVPTEELARWRSQIAACLRSHDCDTVAAANFYRAVRDPAAADSLLDLLEQSPLSVWLLDAVVHQGKASGAERLRRLSEAVPDPAVRQMYLAAAKRL